VTPRARVFGLLILGWAGSAQGVPWSGGNDVDAHYAAALVVEGHEGHRTGYGLGVVDWNGDDHLDLVVSEPGADFIDDEFAKAEGRLGIFYGPLTSALLGSSLGVPEQRSLDDADLVLDGPEAGQLGRVVVSRPAGDDGPALAVAAPSVLGIDPLPAGWTSGSYHFGEVWMLDASAPTCPARGVAPAVDCAVSRLWWEGRIDRDTLEDKVTVEGPHEFAYELARVPDLDGDGLDELAVTAALTVAYGIDEISWFNAGEILIIPGDRVRDGETGPVQQGWRLANGWGGQIELVGNALAGSEPGDAWQGLVVGTLSHDDYLGGAFLVDADDVGDAGPVTNLGEPLHVDLEADARTVTGTETVVAVGREYTLGTDVALLEGGWLAVAANGWPDTADGPVRAVTELFFVPDLVEDLLPGQSVEAPSRDPWVLIGDANTEPIWTDFEAFATRAIEFVIDTLVDLALEADQFYVCVAGVPEDDGEAVARCLHPLVHTLALTELLLGEFPRSFHVPAAHPGGLLIGEPLYGSSSGAVHVIAADIPTVPGMGFHLEPQSPYAPSGWSIGRISTVEPSSWLGHTVLSPGDVDGDGRPDLVLGAPGPPAGDADGGISGRTYLLLTGDYTDLDGDGFSIWDGDCDDEAATVYPGADEICDARDSDCDGLVPPDEIDHDGDGAIPCLDDCDDTDARVHPLAAETCNGLDDNCDGLVDEGTTCPRGCGCTDAGRFSLAQMGWIVVLGGALGRRRFSTRYPA
jgi:hypothetical protein